MLKIELSESESSLLILDGIAKSIHNLFLPSFSTVFTKCFLLLTAGFSVAGVGDKNKRQYFRLDPSLKVDDYQSGSLFVKLKPEYRNVFSGVGTEANRVANFFKDIDLSVIEL